VQRVRARRRGDGKLPIRVPAQRGSDDRQRGARRTQVGALVPREGPPDCEPAHHTRDCAQHRLVTNCPKSRVRIKAMVFSSQGSNRPTTQPRPPPPGWFRARWAQGSAHGAPRMRQQLRLQTRNPMPGTGLERNGHRIHIGTIARTHLALTSSRPRHTRVSPRRTPGKASSAEGSDAHPLVRALTPHGVSG
jgi:hypothetical protein